MSRACSQNAEIKMYKTIILSYALYFMAVKTRSVMLMEERRLGEYKNRIMMKIYGPKRNENEQSRKFPNLYLTSDAAN